MALLAGPALAQDRPLTTLMRPPAPTGPALIGRTDSFARHDRLFGDNPLTDTDSLSRQDLLSGQPPATGRPEDAANPDNQASAACDAGPTRPTSAGLSMGGSGLGEYGRFVGGGHDPATKPGEPATRTQAGESRDQPLYGGTDRPLWSDGSAKPRSQGGQRVTAASRARPSVATGETRRAAGASEPRQAAPAGTAAPAADQPLWADSASGIGTTVDPCDSGVATQRAVVPAPPTAQTLYFGTRPAR